MSIKKGDKIRIKPEWQDAGDDDCVWLAIEDEDGGRVRIEPQLPAEDWNPALLPNQIVTTEMIELAP